jgi:hypothetical protein
VSSSSKRSKSFLQSRVAAACWFVVVVVVVVGVVVVVVVVDVVWEFEHVLSLQIFTCEPPSCTVMRKPPVYRYSSKTPRAPYIHSTPHAYARFLHLRWAIRRQLCRGNMAGENGAVCTRKEETYVRFLGWVCLCLLRVLSIGSVGDGGCNTDGTGAMAVGCGGGSMDVGDSSGGGRYGGDTAIGMTAAAVW